MFFPRLFWCSENTTTFTFFQSMLPGCLCHYIYLYSTHLVLCLNLPVSLSICQSVSLSVCLSVCLSHTFFTFELGYNSKWLTTFVLPCLSVCLSVCPSVCLSVRPSARPPVCLTLYYVINLCTLAEENEGLQCHHQEGQKATLYVVEVWQYQS